MGSSNGKIFAPVSIKDVNDVLRTNFTSVDKLCTADAIKYNNGRFSIYKPVAHTIRFGSGDSTSKLSAEEAKGAEALINEGIIYGLKVGQGVNNWQNLHECNYELVGIPDGSNYPFRLADFIGYDHNAKPTLSGSIVTTQLLSSSIDLKCGILWQDTNNTTGIDIMKLAARDGDISNYYVNVLVGTYVKTCGNKNTEHNDITTIKVNGEKQSLFGVDSLPQIYGVGDAPLCTFFLSSKLFENWTDISRGTQEEVAIALPNAAGQMLTISNSYAAYGSFELGNLTQSGNSLLQDVTCTVAPTMSGKYRIAILINRGTLTGDFSMTANSTSALAPMIPHNLPMSETYDYTTYLYRMDDTGENVMATLAHKTGKVTITV